MGFGKKKKKNKKEKKRKRNASPDRESRLRYSLKVNQHTEFVWPNWISTEVSLGHTESPFMIPDVAE